MQRLSKIKRFIPSIVFLVFSIVFVYEVSDTVNRYNRTDKVINEDAFGYYIILPAFLKYKDPNYAFLDTVLRKQEKYKNYIPPVVNQIDNEKKVCKYYSGPAILEAPFYLLANLISNDDFDQTHHTLILIASIFYTLIGGLLLFKLIISIGHSAFIAIGMIAFTLFGTNLFVYTSYDAAYSHAFSFFAFSAFIYCTYQVKIQAKSLYYFLAGCLFGLILIIRPLNAIIIGIVPIVWGKSIFNLLKSRNTLYSIIGSLIMPILQSLLWHWQTGKWYVYPYGEETLNLWNPQLSDFVFSYNCGWAIYTPGILLILILSIVFLILQKHYFKVVFSVSIALLTLYLMSCWYYLHYGCTAGCRPITEYYSLIIILFAYSTKKYFINFRNISIALSFLLLLTLYNRIVMYQFFNHIINWCDMDKQRFEMVFLKTDRVYNYSTYPFWDFGRFDNRNYVYNTINLNQTLNLNSSIEIPLSSIDIGDSSLLFDFHLKAANTNKEAYLDFLITDNGQYVEQQTLLICRKVESAIPKKFKFQFHINKSLSRSAKISLSLKSSGSKIPCTVNIETIELKRIRY